MGLSWPPESKRINKGPVPSPQPAQSPAPRSPAKNKPRSPSDGRLRRNKK